MPKKPTLPETVKVSPEAHAKMAQREALLRLQVVADQEHAEAAQELRKRIDKSDSLRDSVLSLNREIIIEMERFLEG